MAKNYFKPNLAGQIALRNSPKVQKDLLRRANAIKSQAMNGAKTSEYKCDVQPGKTRAHARCSTANAAAYWRQLRYKNLSSAIDAAG